MQVIWRINLKSSFSSHRFRFFICNKSWYSKTIYSFRSCFKKMAIVVFLKRLDWVEQFEYMQRLLTCDRQRLENQSKRISFRSRWRSYFKMGNQSIYGASPSKGRFCGAIVWRIACSRIETKARRKERSGSKNTSYG